MENLNDDVTYVFEPAVIRLTPYDKRLKELRALEQKRDELLKRPYGQRRVAQLDYLIKKAEDRFEREKERGADDDWRRLRDIDEWRSRDGREIRNTSRRRVRIKPNEDLSHLTTEQKEQRKRDQRADANFIKRQEAKGLAVSEIQAGLLLRQQQRERMRGAATEAESAMSRNPAFGNF